MKLAAAFCVALVLSASASAQTTWTESTVYAFTGAQELFATQLVQASDGNFYGALPSITSQSSGYLYQLTPAGSYTLLYSFTGGNDGAHPNARLVEAPDGYLYGETEAGGANGNGTLFRIPLGTSGALQTIYTVPANAMGAPTNCLELPDQGLTLGSDGNLYGVAGPDANQCLFAFAPAASATVAIVANVLNDEVTTASGAPLQASDGNFYWAIFGGLGEYSPSAKTSQSIPVTLNDNGIGISPSSELVQGADGQLYFTTTNGDGGADSDDLAVKTTLGGSGTLLHAFTQVGGDEVTGVFPASDGNFYGAEALEGANSEGDIYQLTSAGALTDIFDFDGTDGAKPQASPMQGMDGAIYGTTVFAGSESSPTPGVVWKLAASPALAAPVQMSFTPSNPTAGSAATIHWSVNNANSVSMQQCYAYGTWTGKQTGAYNGTTHVYSGSLGVTIPSSGSYNYALTCGGRESQILASSLLASSTALSVSPNPQTVGGNVTLSVVVSGSGPTPSGQVQLKDGTETVATLNLSGGKAMLTTPTTAYPAGTYPLVAIYSGNSTYQGSESSTVNVVLSKAASTTTMTATPNPVSPPTKVTLKATVKSAETGITPTGLVTFYVGSMEIGSAKLSGGSASLTAPTTGIAAGNYPVIAKYAGDDDNKASQSSAVTVVVQ